MTYSSQLFNFLIFVDSLTVNNFQNEASKAELDLTGDSEEMFRARKKWDRQKKKMITVEVTVILTGRGRFCILP